MSQEPFDFRPDRRPASERGLDKGEVYANVDALFELEVMVIEGLQQRPGKGMEVGGLLLGVAGGDVRIEGVEPLPIEHRFGPSFWLCSSDVEIVKRKIESAQTTVLGHFRSRKGNESEVEDVDHAIADLLRVPEPILLLIPVVEGRLAEWLIYRRTSGNWVQLFRGSPTAIPQLPVPALRGLTAPVTAPAPLEEPSAPIPSAAPVMPAPARQRWWVGPAAALAMALLLLTCVVLWRQTVPLRRDPVTEIGLAAQPSRDGIRVIWNRESSVVKESTSGRLMIRDGDNSQELRLSQDQLRGGSVLYVPLHSQVQFRLEVYRDRVYYSGESVTTATGVPSTQNNVAPAREAPHENPPSEASSAAPDGVRVPPERPRSSPIANASSRNTSIAREQRPALVPFVQPSPVRRIAVIPTPPQVSIAQPANAPEILASLSTSTPLPPSLPFSAAPTGSREPTISFIAAVPVRKARPAVPPNLHSVVENVVSVDVKVVIDATGKVVSATPTEAYMPAQKMLAPQAVQAALLWRFEPARRNGQPVISESVLKFDFERR